MTGALLADPACLTDRLEEMLSESVSSAVRREQTAFDEMAAPFEDRLVLFGCGGLGQKTLAGLRKVGIEPLAFADNNRATWGKDVDGLTVLSPSDAAARFGHCAAFVVTIWNGSASDRMADRLQQLAAIGCRKVIPAGFLFWKFSAVFLPMYPVDLPHKVLLQKDLVRSVFPLWSDPASSQEFLAQIAFRLRLDFDGLAVPVAEHYFAPDVFRLNGNETLVDCGAFDGDTIRSFVDRQGENFHHIAAFEPDALNWRKLEETVAALPRRIQSKITCFQRAVGAEAATVAFDATGTDLSTAGSGSTRVECVTLDDSLRNLEPTIIKFDIEGAEPGALQGAREIIRRCRPVLAVSTYHLQAHLWELPALIRSLHDGYRFRLRPHGSEGWDLVCYAVPPGRLAGSE